MIIKNLYFISEGKARTISLTKRNESDIERIRRSALKIILKDRYNGYQSPDLKGQEGISVPKVCQKLSSLRGSSQLAISCTEFLPEILKSLP